MTVLSSEMPMVGTARAVLPRVNLLPPEIAEKAAFRRVQMALGGVAAGAVAVVGVLYMSATHSVSSANEELASAKSQTVKLQADVNKFRDVTAIYNAADAAQAQLVQAMADEVRYSQMLNDVSLSIPSNVWITELVFTQTAPKAAPAASTRVPTAVPPLGTLTVSGTAFAHDDVAAWLDALGGLKTYSNPYFSQATEKLIGTRKVVEFSSTAELTNKALSGRYTARQGG